MSHELNSTMILIHPPLAIIGYVFIYLFTAMLLLNKYTNSRRTSARDCFDVLPMLSDAKAIFFRIFTDYLPIHNRIGCDYSPEIIRLFTVIFSSCAMS